MEKKKIDLLLISLKSCLKTISKPSSRKALELNVKSKTIKLPEGNRVLSSAPLGTNHKGKD